MNESYEQRTGGFWAGFFRFLGAKNSVSVLILALSFLAGMGLMINEWFNSLPYVTQEKIKTGLLVSGVFLAGITLWILAGSFTKKSLYGKQASMLANLANMANLFIDYTRVLPRAGNQTINTLNTDGNLPTMQHSIKPEHFIKGSTSRAAIQSDNQLKQLPAPKVELTAEDFNSGVPIKFTDMGNGN